MAKKFYVVKIGKIPGVYETWAECQNQINGFAGAVYKGFTTEEEAIAFVDEGRRKQEKQEDTILKLLSPSVSLRKVNIDLEDYSCYTFPVLRALEGYIKYLFGLKGIVIGNTFSQSIPWGGFNAPDCSQDWRCNISR
ncbi:MAG: viroplasmin family protein [Eubacterium sp.]|nr:viroplasmin family protein [Eubacterium sp.]